jgi:hypothetical protein
MNNMEIKNETEKQDANLVRTNARLRKEVTTYQNALEAMEVKLRSAEQTVKLLRRKFTKVSEVMSTLNEENQAV